MSKILGDLTPQPKKRLPKQKQLVEFNLDLWASKLIGQRHVIEAIAPYVEVYESGLNTAGRPAGVFLLTGPTGVGKTKTIETLAGILHDDENRVLTVDCSEFQHDHDIASMVGSRLGYIGSDASPVFNQKSLDAVSSKHCDLSLILLDEVEKAAKSFHRLLLGIFDKGRMRTGQNKMVDFTNTMIFMTCNIGVEEVARAAENKFAYVTTTADDVETKKAKAAQSAIRRVFSPEFRNRVDETLWYKSLTEDEMRQILDLELQALQQTVDSSLVDRAFYTQYTPAVKEFLMEKGFSKEYGARELKRVIRRYVTLPLARVVNSDLTRPGESMKAIMQKGGDGVEWHYAKKAA